MSIHKVGHYTFRWTSEHMSKEQVEVLKYQYDELGSEVVTKLRKIIQSTKETVEALSPHRVDLYELLRDHHAEDQTLSRFWEETHSVPEWVDWDQIERGQKFFYRYALGNLVGFALQGFMGENTATTGTAEVLIRTGGFSTRVLLRRLLETFQFVLQVTDSLDAVKPGGAGHTMAVRVRLLHSMVRERIMNLERTRGNYFDMEELGVPINLIGSIHSISTFSCNQSWLQLPLMGVYPNDQETADYIALFRYLGHVLGTPTEYFETSSRAKATMESMLVNEFRTNNSSFIVAHNFIHSLTDLPPFNISKQFIEAGSRFLNGEEFCDKIGLGRPGPYPYACFKGFCWLVRGLAFVQHSSPSFDRIICDFSKRTLHDAVRSGLGGASKSHFKHIPQTGKQTGKENRARIQPSPWFFRRPVEGLFFGIFLLVISPLLAALFLASRYLFLGYSGGDFLCFAQEMPL